MNDPRRHQPIQLWHAQALKRSRHETQATHQEGARVSEFGYVNASTLHKCQPLDEMDQEFAELVARIEARGIMVTAATEIFVHFAEDVDQRTR